MTQIEKVVPVITACQWATHIGNRVSYLGEIWTLTGVSVRPTGIWLELTHPKYDTMPTQATSDCKPVVWDVEKMNREEMSQLASTFIFERVVVTGLKFYQSQALHRMLKIKWHVYNGGNGNTDAGPDQLYWLNRRGYFTGQFPEDTYILLAGVEYGLGEIFEFDGSRFVVAPGDCSSCDFYNEQGMCCGSSSLRACAANLRADGISVCFKKVKGYTMSLSAKELNAVRDLGEKIGYGNMMCIASALWRKNLIDMGLPSSGATVPALLRYIKPKDLTEVTEECAHYDSLIKEAGSSCRVDPTCTLLGIIEARLSQTGYAYKWEFSIEGTLNISLSDISPSKNPVDVYSYIKSLFKDLPQITVCISDMNFKPLSAQEKQ